MKLDPAVARRFATFVLFAFLGFLFWRLWEGRGREVELVYDLSRVGRTDLVEMRVALWRDGDIEREAGFFFAGGEGSAPAQQRHRVRLREGRYEGRFVLRFSKAPELRVAVPFSLPRPEPVVLVVAPSASRGP
jgi:hypothetical protein